ncbi:protein DETOXIFICATION 48 [Selaginella moellendorffii]|nr:protein DETOXIFICATION 48 [Selaginella moellendorffii]|eukprot:XP_002978667.2 protein DETOXIFICATION 48 [Selaginella moellendorffii]
MCKSSDHLPDSATVTTTTTTATGAAVAAAPESSIAARMAPSSDSNNNATVANSDHQRFAELPRLIMSHSVVDMPLLEQEQHKIGAKNSSLSNAAGADQFGQTMRQPNVPSSKLDPDSTKQHQISGFFAHDFDGYSQWPTPAEVARELKQMGSIACPTVVTGILVYLRSLISMLFLGHLGELELAGGSLAIGFANITGYSVLSGLAMGMEPICGQAFGAHKWKLMGLTLQRSVVFLSCSCLPIALLWLNMNRILNFCGQDPAVTAMAHNYLLFSLPDLLIQALLNPIRVYLRTQKITLPISIAAAVAICFHVPANLLLVSHLGLGIRGVALAAVATNLTLVLVLLLYVIASGIYKLSWPGISRDCLRDWRPLLALAIPSAISVCLEWWWYELMIIFSGLLVNARAAVATMGVLIQTTALVYIFPSSLGLAVSTRVGNELGANNPRGARTAAHVALCCAGVLGLVAMSFTVGMRHVWGSLFTRDAAILKLVAAAMPVVGMCEIGNCPQTTGCGVLRGSARPTLGANINLGSFYFVGMPVAMLLGFALDVGFVGLWFGLLAAQGSCLVLMLFAVGRTDWELQAFRAQELTGSSNSSTPSSSGKIGAANSIDGGSKVFELGCLDSDEDEEDNGSDSCIDNGKDVPLMAIKVSPAT